MNEELWTHVEWNGKILSNRTFIHANPNTRWDARTKPNISILTILIQLLRFAFSQVVKLSWLLLLLLHFMSTDHSDILQFCLSLLVLHFKWYVMSSSDLRKQGQDVHSEPPVYGEEVGSPVEILQTNFSWEVWNWTRGTPQEFVGRGKCDAFQLYCVRGYILCFQSKTPRGPRQ